MTDVRAETPSITGRLRGAGGRGHRSSLGSWFFDVDRMLLALAFSLIAVGLVAVAAASPATAQRYSGGTHHLAPLHYFWRQLTWVGISVPVMLLVSMLPVVTARRFALIGAAMFFAALAVTPFAGVVVNGARRWLDIGIGQFQPSEFLKPFFIVAIAWLLSLKAKADELPVVPITLGMIAAVAALLMMQPDFGQTIVFCLVWFALLAIAGTSRGVLVGIAACGPALIGLAYLFYGTARARIDAFLFPSVDGEGAGDHFQVDAAHATLTAGGWTGTGPGGGHAKFGLPEAHTDYIFSVVGEEFGLIACVGIALLFLAVVVRVFVKLLDEQDEFKLLAASGLAIQFGAQALVSMAVNTGLAPSKGMTLPFISYGGSSMLALSIGMGLLLAFTRRNPFLTRSPYVVKWGQA